jgi:hypothetical protein
MSSKFLEAHISTCSIVHKQQKSGHLVMMGAMSSVLPDTPRRQSWLCIVKWNKYFMHGFILRNLDACVDGLLAACTETGLLQG